MLRLLEIRDLLLMEHVSLAPGAGLNVLTGETGAGKSILLDALGLALGWRGRGDLLRHGAPRGEVTAVFDLSPDHAARDVLAEAGVDCGEELILRRTLTADGRKQAHANDRRVSTATLRALAATLVELQGQRDSGGLLNPAGHRALLDAHAGIDTAHLRDLWATWRDAESAIAAAEERIGRMRAEEDFLRHAVTEFDALAPMPGEDDELDAQRRRMQRAVRIRDDIARALEALAENGAAGRVRDADRWLEGVAEHAEGALDEPLAAIARAEAELAEAEAGVEACLETLAFDPRELEQVEERLFAIRALARKHGIVPDDLPAHADMLRGELARLDAGEADLDHLRKTARQARTAYDEEAARVHQLRRAGAGELDQAMTAELAPLKMARAVFATEVTPAPPGPEGTDAVAFVVATNPGAPAGPLQKIASGGELSRFLLALRVCLSGEAGDVTLIFDEIDRGVGGATADAVGRRLRDLADGSQVIVVTHSPQVAALAAHHWRVEKRVADGVVHSAVTPLDAAGRVEEIARMLSGDRVTDAARAAARTLLAA